MQTVKAITAKITQTVYEHTHSFTCSNKVFQITLLH